MSVDLIFFSILVVFGKTIVISLANIVPNAFLRGALNSTIGGTVQQQIAYSRSNIECTIQCLKNSPCQGVIFSRERSECQLFSSHNGSGSFVAYNSIIPAAIWLRRTPTIGE